MCSLRFNVTLVAIIGTIKAELRPLYIITRLNDIIILSAPIINNQTIYYISKPNGDEIKLDLNIYENNYHSLDKNNILVNYSKEELKEIKESDNEYSIYNLNIESCLNKKNRTQYSMPNEFTIGPLTGHDHGNWVLSAYYKNLTDWVEVFQVITIEIKELTATEPSRPKLKLGDTFNLRFALPIKELQSCEIVAPKSTYDRFYDRNKEFSDFCSFRIPNVTKSDEGLWKIIGVGRIVYEGKVYLRINDHFFKS